MNKKLKEILTSRRMWGSALGLIATALIIAFPNANPLIEAGCTVVASALGIVSFTFPK